MLPTLESQAWGVRKRINTVTKTEIMTTTDVSSELGIPVGTLRYYR
jgi:hypothetical protein